MKQNSPASSQSIADESVTFIEHHGQCGSEEKCVEEPWAIGRPVKFIHFLGQRLPLFTSEDAVKGTGVCESAAAPCRGGCGDL